MTATSFDQSTFDILHLAFLSPDRFCVQCSTLLCGTIPHLGAGEKRPTTNNLTFHSQLKCTAGYLPLYLLYIIVHLSTSNIHEYIKKKEMVMFACLDSGNVFTSYAHTQKSEGKKCNSMELMHIP